MPAPVRQQALGTCAGIIAHGDIDERGPAMPPMLCCVRERRGRQSDRQFGAGEVRSVPALFERGPGAFALPRTGGDDLLHGGSVLHAPEAFQDARVIRAVARQQHRPIPIELVARIAHEARRGRVPASPQRAQDALVIPLLFVECGSRKRAEDGDEQQAPCDQMHGFHLENCSGRMVEL